MYNAVTEAPVSNRFWALLGIVVLELIAVVWVFQIATSFECQQTQVETACRILRGSVARAVSLIAVLGVTFAARRAAFTDLRKIVNAEPGQNAWLGLHGLGLAMIFLPALLLTSEGLVENFGVVLWVLLLGAIIAGIGFLFVAARPSAWRRWLSLYGLRILPLLGLAIVLPDIANLILPLWGWDTLTNLTFNATLWTLGLFDASASAQPEIYVLGAGTFFVRVASQCSGVEGFALVTVFLGLYALLFRRELRMGRFWLVMLPFAILASWVLNILRITTLILIGANGSPNLALNGFHSYAGWMFFIILALGILVIAQSVTWFDRIPRDTSDQGAALGDDWTAARILPFVMFMFTGIAASAFWADGVSGYPYRVVVLIGVLWFFRRCYKALPWTIDPLALAAGLLVGVGWVAAGLWVGTSEVDTSGVAAMTGLVFVVWFIARILGTVLLVPLIEELFFRGYILTRLNTGSPLMRVLAVCVSSALFGLLHGRWLEAFAAGVVFALVMLRSGRVTDAVLAHMAANATVALWASATGNWDMI